MSGSTETAPTLAIVGAALWLGDPYELAGWQILLVFFASLPVAVCSFLLTIPLILATDAWLTKQYGVALSERKPPVLSPGAIRRLHPLPRYTRVLSLVLAGPIALLAPVGAVYVGAVGLGLTSGDLRGQAWPAIGVLSVIAVALLWLEPKASRLLDRRIVQWDALRRSNEKMFGRRRWWASCVAIVVYLTGTPSVPFLIALLMVKFGIHHTFVGAPTLLVFAIAAVGNLYLSDVLAMKLTSWFSTGTTTGRKIT